MSYFVGATTHTSNTTSDYVKGLLNGDRWLVENDNKRLTYSFITNQYWDYDFLYQAEVTAFYNAIESWSNVADFQLEFTGYNDPDAEITFHSVDSNLIGSFTNGAAVPPLGEEGVFFGEGTVLINRDFYRDNPNLKLVPGGYNYMTFVHEMGHALGLAHPHDSGGTSGLFPGVGEGQEQNPGTDGLNQFIWTAMSYVDVNSSYSPNSDTNWGFVGGPMAFDIAAIQDIYGANNNYNTGNDVYYLPTTDGVIGTYWSSIWDAGGIDTISGQEATQPVTINLNEASLRNDDPKAGGHISRVGNIKGGFTIANNVTIENAIGGSNSDRITGNAARNNLQGRSGNDTLAGRGGRDTLIGGGGRDSLSGDAGRDLLNGGGGNDTLDGGGDRDTLTGNGGSDLLDGQGGRDILRGGSGNDGLIGGGGNDVLFGNGGRDIFALESGKGRDTIQDFADGVDRFLLGSGLTFDDLNIRNNAQNTASIVRDDSNIPIALVRNIDASSITEADFV